MHNYGEVKLRSFVREMIFVKFSKRKTEGRETSMQMLCVKEKMHMAFEAFNNCNIAAPVSKWIRHIHIFELIIIHFNISKIIFIIIWGQNVTTDNKRY